MTGITKFLGAVATIAMFAGAAQAADVESAPDSPSWTGGYIGVVGGYGWGDSEYESSAVFTDTLVPIPGSENGSVDFEGFLIGGQLGYDFDFGNGFVLGVAGDMSWSDMDGAKCVQPGGCTGSPDDTHSYSDIDWLATIRGRAGFTTGSLLIYGAGGLAMAHAEATVTFVDGTLDTPRSDSNTHLGWVLGAGAEFKVTENMSLGAEYLHVDLGSEDYTFPGPGGGIDVLSESDLQIDIVRASLNLRF